MGLVRGLERGLEKMVARAFRGSGDGVKPVEIANRIRNTMDDEAFALSEGRTVAPHSFTIRLGDDDYAKAREWGLPLAQELADVALEHAEAQDYTLRDAVTVTFRHDSSLPKGRLEVDPSLGGPQSTPPRPTRRAAPGGGAGAAAGAGADAAAAAARPAAPRIDIPEGATTRVDVPGMPRPPRAPRPPQPVIEVEGRRYAVNAATITIGRSSEADIQVSDSGVSRKHIAIERRGDRVFVKDLGSTNGSFVNGARLDPEAELLDGSVVTAGHTRVTFHLVPDQSEVD